MTPVSLNKFSSFIYGSRLLAETFALEVYIQLAMYMMLVLDIAKGKILSHKRLAIPKPFAFAMLCTDNPLFNNHNNNLKKRKKKKKQNPNN